MLPMIPYQIKQNPRTCQQCRGHGIISILKNHKFKCQYDGCACEKCVSLRLTNARKNNNKRMRRHQIKRDEEIDELKPIPIHAVSTNQLTTDFSRPEYKPETRVQTRTTLRNVYECNKFILQSAIICFFNDFNQA